MIPGSRRSPLGAFCALLSAAGAASAQVTLTTSPGCRSTTRSPPRRRSGATSHQGDLDPASSATSWPSRSRLLEKLSTRSATDSAMSPSTSTATSPGRFKLTGYGGASLHGRLGRGYRRWPTRRSTTSTSPSSTSTSGLKVLAVFTHGPGIVLNTKRPVTRLADFDGLKFRVGGGMVNDIGKVLGINVTLQACTPVLRDCCPPASWTDVFFPAESVASFKLEKLIKYRTDVPRWPLQHQLRHGDESRRPGPRSRRRTRRPSPSCPASILRAQGWARLGQGGPQGVAVDAGQRRRSHQGEQGLRRRGQGQDFRAREQVGSEAKAAA